MKNQLKSLLALLLTAPLMLSCEDKMQNSEDGSYQISYETPEFWGDGNFQSMNDEFNSYREFLVAMMDPASDIYEGSAVLFHNYGYNWVEVTYPKGKPEKVQYSIYKTYTKERYYPYVIGEALSENTVIYVDALYKDGKLIGDIEVLPHGKKVLHVNKKRKLLYDCTKIYRSANEIYHISTYPGEEESAFYTFSEANTLFESPFAYSGEHESCEYIATDPYGGKVMGYFGSLTSYLLPVNGPCAEDMVQEVIAIRSIDYGLGYTPSDINKYDRVYFMYKNTESPAVPYLPESIWDIDDNSLWVINN